MPAFADVLAMGAAILGVATWIIPWLRYSWQWRTPPKTSLAGVGRVIGFVVLAGCLSAAALLLALIAFVFAERTGYAWIGLGATIGFWLAFALFLGLGKVVSRHKQH
jgi:hypothetical protein